MRRLKGTILLLLLSCFYLNAQLAPSIPTSPQAEAFKKYGDYGVNYATGVPEISIPLYEIAHHGYKIPVALNYIAQPLKPGYNYDVYGFGWSLSPRGSISRSIEYKPDEQANFALEPPPTGTYYQYCAPYCLTDYNYAHDKFNAILPDGSSFDFIIEKQGTERVFVVSEKRNVKISCDYNGQIDSLTIIDENGVTYTFQGADTPAYGSGSAYAGTYVSWLLTRIDLPHSAEPIYFSHSMVLNTPSLTCGEPKLTVGGYFDQGPSSTYINTPVLQRSADYPFYAYSMHLLTSVSWGNATLYLNYANASGSSNNYVEKLLFYEGSSLIKEISLNRAVNTSGYSPCLNPVVATLSSVQINGSDNPGLSQVYEFSYKSIHSFGGTDHWGYLNYSGNDQPNFNFFMEWNSDEHALSSAITKVSPEIDDIGPYHKYKLTYPGSGAQFNDYRQPAPPEAHGVLTRIKYPTGGYTEFEFENHRFLTSMEENGNYIYNPANRIPKFAAGFRIKTITNYSAEGILATKNNYRYGKTNAELYGSNHPYPNTHSGLGQEAVDPNILTYATYKHYPHQYIRNMTINLNEYGQKVAFSNPYRIVQSVPEPWEWECTFSVSNFRRLVGGRSPVMYSDVTVYEGPFLDDYETDYLKGKTVYRYGIRNEDTGEDFFESLLDYNDQYLGYASKSHLYNKLLEKTEYQNKGGTLGWVPVRKEINTWGELTHPYMDYVQAVFYPSHYFFAMAPISNMFTPWYNVLGKKFIIDKMVTEYTPEGDSITVSEAYQYDSKGFLITKTLLRSEDGQSIKDQFTRVPESSHLPAGLKQDMIDKNIIAPVVVSQKGVSNSSGTTPTDGNRIEYAKFGGPQIIMPSKYYEQSVTASGTQYQLRSEVKRYSDNGNALEIVAGNRVPAAYLWGYNDRYLVAEVKNASYNEVYLGNFEDRSGWDGALSLYDDAVSRTGAVSGRIDKPGPGEQVSHSTQTLQISLTASKRFRYSGWVYSNGPSADIFLFMKRAGEPGYYSYIDITTTTQTGRWVYLEKEVEVPADVTQLNIRLDNNGGGSVWFDDIRICPADALMSTYTYAPSIGITSMAGPDGRPNFYNYDALGRLSMTKDHQGNILQKYCYTLSGQPYACDENSTVAYRMTAGTLWEPTGETRCETNTSGAFTGYLQRQERDEKTTSATYKKIRWSNTRMDIKACPLNQLFAKLHYTNPVVIGDKYYADVEIRFYQDPGGAVPAQAYQLPVSYTTTKDLPGGKKNSAVSTVTVKANGHITIAARRALIGSTEGLGGDWVYKPGAKNRPGIWERPANITPHLSFYQLANGTGYGIIE